MNRIQAEDYIYASYLRAERFLTYESKDSQKRNPNLTKAIIDSLNSTPCVLVTGSKGKGSVANMISQILQSRHRVGLMTSPHIEAFNERFRVNNVPISDADFVRTVEALKVPFDQIESTLPCNVCISPMGIQAAIGLLFFANEHTSYNVFELGKGAKYDDVNNIDSLYSVINTIFLEHTRELGETVEKIAEDKSHVIKTNQLGAFIAEQEPEVLRIIIERAEKQGVPISIYGQDFRADNIRYTNRGMLFDVIIKDELFSDILVPLLGEHQAKNCALALALCHSILPDRDILDIKKRLAQLEWPGRMEIISRSPLVLLDACINKNSTENIRQVLAQLGIEKCVFIVGIPDDKDYEGVVCSVQGMSEATILTKSKNPHYRFTDIQKQRLQEKGITTIGSNSVEEAISIAKKFNGPVAILGTTSIISDVKRMKW